MASVDTLTSTPAVRTHTDQGAQWASHATGSYIDEKSKAEVLHPGHKAETPGPQFPGAYPPTPSNPLSPSQSQNLGEDIPSLTDNTVANKVKGYFGSAPNAANHSSEHRRSQPGEAPQDDNALPASDKGEDLKASLRDKEELGTHDRGISSTHDEKDDTAANSSIPEAAADSSRHEVKDECSVSEAGPAPPQPVMKVNTTPAQKHILDNLEADPGGQQDAPELQVAIPPSHPDEVVETHDAETPSSEESQGKRKSGFISKVKSGVKKVIHHRSSST